MIDDLGLRTFKVYRATQQQIITDQAMTELSTPSSDSGTASSPRRSSAPLDSARTQVVMEKLLDTLTALKVIRQSLQNGRPRSFRRWTAQDWKGCGAK
jgi:hypothetical protein